MIHATSFGKTSDGKNVLAFTIRDGANEAVILNYGGIVQSLKIADKNGNPIDVVLGYNNIESYENTSGYLGALVGRFANRIDKGHFEIDGEEVQLNCNERGNHLHGGTVGFDKKIWNYVYGGADGNTLELSLISPDGDENYPGNLHVQVSYTLVGGELKIEYAAMSDKKTPINLTNHSYFNLDGEGSGKVLDTFLTIDADRITPTDEKLIPHGEFRNVEKTAFDFRKAHRIGERIGDNDDEDIRIQGGYDANFVLNKAAGSYEKIATAESERSGITMEVFTDMPAVQLYTGNGLSQKGKTAFYNRNYGFCLETQFIPNSMNVPAYAQLGDCVFEKNKIYHSVTAYKFTVK